MQHYSTVLSIAGVDPSGGAGIFADFRAIEAAGARALGAVTALTVQTESSFRSYEPTAVDMLEQTILSMIEAFPQAAVKTGMLPTAEIVVKTAELIKMLAIETVVIDPVVFASVGARLVDEAAEKAIGDHLVPLASLVTPNMHEASGLTGIEVTDLESMEAAGSVLVNNGAAAAVVTGGHLDGAAIDVLVTGDGIEHIKAERLPGSVHGTGCSFASSCSAHLAQGKSVKEAILAAKAFVGSLFTEQRWRNNHAG